MKDSRLWHDLRTADLVNGQQPKTTATGTENLWYVRALQGFAGWLAACFMLGFLAVGVIPLFEHGLVMMFMGLALNTGAFVFYKARNHSDFFEQLVLVFSLTGQFLFAYGLFAFFEYRDKNWLIWIAAYQLLLMYFVDNYLHRLLSAWFAVMALFLGFDVIIYSGLGSAVVGGLFVWLWLDKCYWQAEKEFYEPIGYALAFSLLQLNLHNEWRLGGWFWSQSAEVSWLMLNADWLSALLNSLVLLYFVYRMVQEQQIKMATTTGSLVILAAVVMLFSALPVIGLSSALLVLFVGFARQNKMLMVSGVLALLGFVSWYYYSLKITLLHKSLILMGIGAVMLLGALILKYYFYKQSDESVKSNHDNKQFKLSWWQKTVAILTLVMGLVGVNHAIWQKEQVLATGRAVFLELAPVDPRSIMQGDYMRLRFAISNEIRANQPISSLPNKRDNQDGYVLVKLNDQGVGEFYGLEDNNSVNQVNSEISDNLLTLQYRIRNNRIQFATNAFFFQEGDAQLFEAARFAQFKVAADGEMLLTAMYDQDLKLLGLNRMD